MKFCKYLCISCLFSSLGNQLPKAEGLTFLNKSSSNNNNDNNGNFIEIIYEYIQL